MSSRLHEGEGQDDRQLQDARRAGRPEAPTCHGLPMLHMGAALYEDGSRSDVFRCEFATRCTSGANIYTPAPPPREWNDPLRILDLSDGMRGYSIGIRCRPAIGHTAVVVDENGLRLQTGPHRTAMDAFKAAYDFVQTMVTKGDSK